MKHSIQYLLITCWFLCGLTSAQDTLPKAQEEDQKAPAAESTERERTAADVAREAFGKPPNSVALGKTNNLWIDRKNKRVYLDGYITLKNGALEMFACPSGTKEHESIVASLAKAHDVHAALLAIDTTVGTPVRHLPNFLPATGQVIRVWVCWRDEKKKFQVVDARTWVKHLAKDKAMTAEWVFAGSSFWTDPSDGKEYYQADAGDMICVSNFSTAMMDVTISSSAEANELVYVAFEDRIPKTGTPVRLVLAPVPLPSDQPNAKREDQKKPPTEDVLPKPKQGSK